MGKVNAWCFHAPAAEESATESKEQSASVFSRHSAELRLQKSPALNDRIYSAWNRWDIS